MRLLLPTLARLCYSCTSSRTSGSEPGADSRAHGHGRGPHVHVHTLTLVTCAHAHAPVALLDIHRCMCVLVACSLPSRCVPQHAPAAQSAEASPWLPSHAARGGSLCRHAACAVRLCCTQGPFSNTCGTMYDSSALVIGLQARSFHSRLDPSDPGPGRTMVSAVARAWRVHARSLDTSLQHRTWRKLARLPGSTV